MVKIDKEAIKQNLFTRQVFIALGFLIITWGLNIISGKYIIPLFAVDRVSPNDLFFTFIPYIRILQHCDRIALALMVVLFLYSAIKTNCKCIPDYLNALAIMYLIRCVVILFTPLGIPVGVDLTAVNTHSIFWDSGFFFSGHTAGYVLTYLYLDRKDRTVKYIGLMLLILGLMLILLARHHYLIDIYGGVVTSLLIYEYMKKRGNK